MKRRKFLQIGATAIAASVVPFKMAHAEAPIPTVWESTETSVAALQRLFTAMGGIAQLLPKEPSQATVLIKPNLCLPHAVQLGTITSPAILTTLCAFLTESGIQRIVIADHTLRQASDFKNLEIQRFPTQYPNVKIILADEARWFEPVTVNGKVLQQTEILKLLTRADLVINVATAKHHAATHVSLALKNLMGLVWNRTEFHTRFDLHQAIADLGLVIRPHLNLIDASRVLLDGGPTGPGRILTANRWFASRDLVALDSVVTSRYNFGGKSLLAQDVPHLWAAHQHGLGEIDVGKITLTQLEA